MQYYLLLTVNDGMSIAEMPLGSAGISFERATMLGLEFLEGREAEFSQAIIVTEVEIAQMQRLSVKKIRDYVANVCKSNPTRDLYYL